MFGPARVILRTLRAAGFFLSQTLRCEALKLTAFNLNIELVT